MLMSIWPTFQAHCPTPGVPIVIGSSARIRIKRRASLTRYGALPSYAPGTYYVPPVSLSMYCACGNESDAPCANSALAAADAAHHAPGPAALRAFSAACKFAAAAALVADIFGRAGCAWRGFVARIERLFDWGNHVSLSGE
jgi:hypothetical protein